MLTREGATGNLQEVYRVNTAGWNPPATCAGMKSTFEVQYAAEYVSPHLLFTPNPSLTRFTDIGFSNLRENVRLGKEWGKRKGVKRVSIQGTTTGRGVWVEEYTAGYHTLYCPSGTICLVKFEWVEAGDAQGYYFGVLNNA